MKTSTALAHEWFPVADVRARFPIFSAHPELAYLDSAATAQKPDSVISAERDFWERGCANPGRGTYPLTQSAAALVASTREETARFLGRSNAQEIVFTSGATASLNLVALAWGQHMLRDGDRIHVCLSDHLALNAPWQALVTSLSERGIRVEVVPYRLRGDGSIDIDRLLAGITSRSRVVNVSHASNVAGVINDIAKLRSLLPEHVILNGDLCQSAGHTAIDVGALGLDFASFSGHKCFAGTGAGVLWVHPAHHSSLRPVFYGGGQVSDGDTPAQRLETGSPDVCAIASLREAIGFIDAMRELGSEDYVEDLTRELYARILRMKHIEPVYPPRASSPRQHVGIVSLRVDGMESGEVGDFLSDHDIAVRTGTHCTGGAVFDAGSVRISLQLYNTFDEVQRVADLLERLA